MSRTRLGIIAVVAVGFAVGTLTARWLNHNAQLAPPRLNNRH